MEDQNQLVNSGTKHSSGERIESPRPALVNGVYVVEFPAGHPLRNRTLRLRPTGQFMPYLDLKNGSCFRMANTVYQKMDDSNAAALLPWDDDGYMEMDTNCLVRVVVERLQSAGYGQRT